MSIERKLEDLKRELVELNDVSAATKEIAERTQLLAQQGFQQSQTTDSIDEKIKVLIQTIQVLANEAIDFHNKKEKEVEILNIKIELLEKIIEETVVVSIPTPPTAKDVSVENFANESMNDLNEDEKKDS